MVVRHITKHQKGFMLQIQVTKITWKLTDNILGYVMEQFYTYITPPLLIFIIKLRQRVSCPVIYLG